MEGISLNYVTLVAAVINLYLGAVVLQENSGGKLNRHFFIFTLALAAWAFVNFYFIQYSQNTILFRATYSFGGIALVLALPWIFFLTEKRFTKITSIGLICLVLIMGLVPLLGGQVIESVSKHGSNFEFSAGPLFNLYGGLLLVLVFYLLYILSTKFISAEGLKKNQLRYILIGISIFAAVSVTFGVILPLFGINTVVAFDAQSSLVWVALTTYAITKHGLFNVKVIATQSFVGILLVLILSRILSANSITDVVFESAVLASTIVVGFFLIGSVRNEVSRREEVEKLAKERTAALEEVEERNKNLATLQRISDIVLNESEMKTMTQKILDEIPNQLESCAGALLSIVKDSQLVAYAISSHQFSDKILSLVGGNLEKYSHPVKKDFNLIHAVLVDKEPHDTDTLSDFISPPIPKAVALTIQKLIGVRHVEAFPLYAGGEPFGVMMFVYTAPKEQIREKNFDVAKAIADDMSLAIQRAQAFQKLKDANEYLAQLDKMKDEFISMASHELNTPLAAIEGYLSMILDEGMGKIDKQSRVYLDRAYASSKRLAELILDLLNVSRIEQGRLKMKFLEVNLAELAESVINELQIKADTKKIYLKLDADKAKVPKIWCDPDRIREVFVNLAGNALKFTDKGGVTIRIKPGAAGMIRCEVSDTGRGIATEDQSKLFQKFSQVKREVDEHQGTGLGLYISKNFVDLHKGKLWVESEAGHGATFIFELPALKEAPKEVEGAILERSVTAPTVEVGSRLVDKTAPQPASKPVAAQSPAKNP